MPTKQNICSFNINNFRDDKNFPPHSINGRGRGGAEVPMLSISSPPSLIMYV